MDEQAPHADHIATATGLADLHVRKDRPDRCWWCDQLWPCPDRRWASRVLELAGRPRT